MTNFDPDGALTAFRMNLALINEAVASATGDELPPDAARLGLPILVDLADPSRQMRLMTWSRAFRGTIRLLNSFDRESRVDASQINRSDLEAVLEASERLKGALGMALDRVA